MYAQRAGTFFVWFSSINAAILSEASNIIFLYIHSPHPHIQSPPPISGFVAWGGGFKNDGWEFRSQLDN